MSKSAVPRSYATAKNSYKPAQTSEPGFTLHKLRHDDFHAITGMSESVKTVIPDESQCDGWHAGEVVLLPDGKCRVISGFAIDVDSLRVSPFARIDGRLYHIKALKRA